MGSMATQEHGLDLTQQQKKFTILEAFVELFSKPQGLPLFCEVPLKHILLAYPQEEKGFEKNV